MKEPANAFSFPVRTMQPISLSSFKCLIACLTSAIKASHRALSDFGLFSVIKPTFLASPFFSTKMFPYVPVKLN